MCKHYETFAQRTDPNLNRQTGITDVLFQPKCDIETGMGIMRTSMGLHLHNKVTPKTKEVLTR